MTPAKREKIAQIVVEAATLGDEATAKKHNVDRRTLQRYRARLTTDTELSALVAAKKAKVEEGWADEIPGALRASVTFLKRAAEEGDPKNWESVRAVAGALKMLSETAATWKLLDARIARQTRPPPTADGSPVPSPTGAPARTLGLVAGNGSK